MDEEAERRTRREGREHARFGATEIEGDDRERPGDDDAHSRSKPVQAVGEIDDVHHHDQADHGEDRPGIGDARVGKGERPDEGQRDVLYVNPKVHDDHRSGDLAGELDERRQVEAVVERAHDRD